MTIAITDWSLVAGLLTIDGNFVAPANYKLNRYSVVCNSRYADDLVWRKNLYTKVEMPMTSGRRISRIDLAIWPNGELTFGINVQYKHVTTGALIFDPAPLSVSVTNTWHTTDLVEGYAFLQSGIIEAPVILTFNAPATSDTLTIPVTLYAEDNQSVAGYLITESATPPLASAAGWTAEPPTSYTATGGGTKNLYAWAKDAATPANVSEGIKATVELPSADLATQIQAKQTTLISALNIYNPSLSFLPISVQSTALSSTTLAYGTQQLGAEQAQQVQTSSSSASLSFIGTVASTQVKQSVATNVTLTITGSANQSQAKPLQATEGFNSLATIVFSQQPVVSNGTIYYGTEDLFAGFEGVVVQLTAQQQQIVNASLGFTGSIAQSQKTASQDAAGSLNFSGAIAEAQPVGQQAAIGDLGVVGLNQAQVTQNQVSVATLSFIGALSSVQVQQRQSLAQILSLAKLRVTVRDPLALSISVRDPLRLKISVS